MFTKIHSVIWVFFLIVSAKLMLASKWHRPAALYQTRVNLLLYSFFWVTHRCLNCVCRLCGTLWFVCLGRVKVTYEAGTDRTFRTSTQFFLLTPPMKMEQSVPKRRHIKFRSRWIIQRKEHNVHNTAKVWCQEMFICFPNSTIIYILCIRFLLNITTCFGWKHPKHVVQLNMNKINKYICIYIHTHTYKWSSPVAGLLHCPEGSRKLRLPDFLTPAQDGGKVVSLTHRPLFTPRKCSWYSFLLEAESTPGP